MSEVPGARTHAAPIEVPDDLPEDVAAALRAVLPVVAAAADRERYDPEVPAAFVRAGLHRMPLAPADGGHGPSLDLACRVLAAIGAVDGSAALGFAMHLHVVGSALRPRDRITMAPDRSTRTQVDMALVNYIYALCLI